MTTDDGLSEIQCFDVFQDSRGYIWVGTSAGANKYDGRDVVVYERSNGLLSDHIYSFHEDSQQRIWINNLNGEPVYIKDNVLHNRITDPKLETLKGNSDYIGWVEDNLNRIWFANEEGHVNILSQDTIIRIDLRDDVGSVKQRLDGIFNYKNEVLAVTSTSIKSIDPESLEINWTVSNIQENTFLRNVLFEDKLYLFNLFNTSVFDLAKKELKPLKRLDGNPPIYDCRILNGQILISTAEGISIVRDSYIEDFNLHPTIDSISVSAVHEDMNGDLWIASQGNGIFHYYDNDVEKSKYSGLCNVNFIEKFSEDTTFIAQEDWKLNMFVKGQLIWTKPLVMRGENRFNNIFIKDGELWLTDKYKLHMDVSGNYKTFETYNRQVYYDQESAKYHWIGATGYSMVDDVEKIFKYKDMRELISVDEDRLVFHEIDNPYVFDIDHENYFWVGSEEGLFRIRDKEIEKMQNPELNGSISALKIMDEHLIGVNYGNGLFDFNLKSRKSKLLTRKDGLPTNHFTHLATDEDNIWVSHATGICLLKKRTEGIQLIKNFGREHGVPKGKIKELEVLNGVCHFVVNGKIYSILPSQQVNDTIEVIIDTGELTYYTNESQSIDFDCINFTFGNNINYQYRLMPLDSVWKETNRERVDLEYIPAGDYELEVRAYHPLNLTNPIKRKPIHVEKRWYQESYFRLGLLLLLGSILFFLVSIKAISFNSANFKYWIGELIQKYFVKEQSSSFNIKDIKGIVHLLNINDVRFIKSSGNYLEFHTAEKKYVSRMTMSNAVEKFKMWPDIQRVHRSYMVNFTKIDAIDHKVLKIDDVDIPFTDRYKDIIEKKLHLN